MKINYWLQKWTIGVERQENQDWIKLETKELVVYNKENLERQETNKYGGGTERHFT